MKHCLAELSSTLSSTHQLRKEAILGRWKRRSDGRGREKKDKQQEGRGRQIDFTVTGISNYISHISFQQMFQHKIVAESHGSWKVQLPLFFFSLTINLGLLLCVMPLLAPTSPS